MKRVDELVMPVILLVVVGIVAGDGKPKRERTDGCQMLTA